MDTSWIDWDTVADIWPLWAMIIGLGLLAILGADWTGNANQPPQKRNYKK